MKMGKLCTCLLYYADDLDLENGNVPLVFAFHGHGNTAMYLAESSDWALIGKENGFLTVMVDDHEKCSATDIISLLDALEEVYSIEASIFGQSFRWRKNCVTFDLIRQYGAWLSLCADSDESSSKSEIPQGTVVPTFYVGAQNSPLT